MDSVVLGEPTIVTATIPNSTDVSCNGGADGTATATAGGGTPGYTYNWSSGGTNANETNLTAGTYTVTVTDVNGCTATAQIVIGEPTPLATTTTITSNYNGEDVSCFGSNDGIAVTTPTGGTSPYNFFWSNGSNIDTANGLSAQTYYVTITDDNGCTLVDSVTLTEPTPVTVSVTAQTNVECFGDSTGQLTATGAGGTGNLAYNWNNGNNGSNQINLPAGNYTVTTTDDNGCTATSTATITEPDDLIANINPIGESCNGYCDGIADLTVLGGVTPYSYSWSNNDTIEDIMQLCVGDYSATITDANGCTTDANTVIETIYSDPIADFSIDPERTTVLDTEIEFFDLSFSNINAWSWTFYATDGTTMLGGSNDQNPIFEYPQDTGVYPVILEVYNQGGCVSDTIRYVTIDAIFSIFVPNAFSPNGDGINDFFFPEGVGIDGGNFTMLIYDRWGEVIFQSNSLDDKWDGTAREKGGVELVQEGVYVWKIITRKATLANNKKEFVGHVTLIK